MGGIRIQIRASSVIKDWYESAACHGMDTERFFPMNDNLPDQEIIDTCRDCPVRADCLQHAVDIDAQGYWGGTTRRQRINLFSGRPRTKCPACGNRKTQELSDTAFCNLCGTSW